jgi:hypothetical protein
MPGCGKVLIQGEFRGARDGHQLHGPDAARTLKNGLTVRLFFSPITNRIGNSIVRSEPAAAEDKPGTERG